MGQRLRESQIVALDTANEHRAFEAAYDVI
jgi:hypothetical protein